MKTSNKHADCYCVVLGLAAILLVSSCSSVEPDYTWGASTSLMADSGPESVTPVGTVEESFDTAAPAPTPLAGPEPASYVAMSPVRSRIIEPTIDEPIKPDVQQTPQPVAVKEVPKPSNKKRSGLLSLFGGKKSAKTETAVYEPYSGPVPKTDVTVAKALKPAKAKPTQSPKPVARTAPKPAKRTSSKPVANVAPEPVASRASQPAPAKQRSATAAKKKSSGDFINWLHQSR